MKKILLIILFCLLSIPSFVSANAPLKAAFIRNHDLWVKDGAKEVKITDGAYARNPKWSKDGTWLAFLQGKEENGLHVYHSASKRSFRLRANVNNNFQWSPVEDLKIAFQVNNELFVADAKTLAIRHIAANVKNFSWLPNGSGFLISRKENEKLNSNIILSKILFNSNGGNLMLVEQRFFTVPVGAEEIVISTSGFKYSHDWKWISFLLVPTASVSADSNTLCILSADGRVFKRVDEMLNYNDWMQWAPTKNELGFISGIGREVVKNKGLMVVEVPLVKELTFTPKGVAERDFAWLDDKTILVSRAKESEWIADVKQRPMPSLVKINLASKRSEKVTFPSTHEGDFAPQVIEKKVIWVRTDRESANVYVSGVEMIEGEVWIKGMDLGSSYYEKWFWDEVFCLYR